MNNNLFIHAKNEDTINQRLQNPKNPSRLNIALAKPWTLFRGVWQVSIPLTASVHWGEASSSDTASQASIDLKGSHAEEISFVLLRWQLPHMKWFFSFFFFCNCYSLLMCSSGTILRLLKFSCDQTSQNYSSPGGLPLPHRNVHLLIALNFAGILTNRMMPEPILWMNWKPAKTH